MSEPVREVLTWELFGRAARELAQTVVDSDFEPDLIMSITRGVNPRAPRQLPRSFVRR